MADMTELKIALPRESEIERRLDELLALMAAGSLDHKVTAEYQELLASRARLMRPPPIRIGLSGIRRSFARA